MASLGRKHKWSTPQICDCCGERAQILAVGLCRKCYYRKYKENQERIKLQARLEKMVDIVNILKGELDTSKCESGISLTVVEDYIWERQNLDSIATLSRKTGISVSDVERAYENGMRFYLGTPEKYFVRKKGKEPFLENDQK